MTRHCSIALLLTILACGPDRPVGDGGDTAGTEGNGDGDGGDGDGDGDSGDGDGDGGDGDGDGGDGDGDGDGDVPLTCAPPAQVFVDFTVMPGDPLDATCAVIGENAEDTYYEMNLDCEGQMVSVALDSTILYKPTLYMGVTIDYRTEDTFFGQNRWLAIHDVDGPQGLVLGAVSSEKLDPPGITLMEFFGAPGLSESAEQPCEALPDADQCGLVRRLALDVTTEFGVGNDPVFDHGSWFADFLAYGFAIEVEQAWRYTRVSPNCTDVETSFFELAAVWFPSD